MATLLDLRDLLQHEIEDLYSAEEQIIDALPKMVEKATNAELKAALQEHRKVTQKQKERLDKVKRLLGKTGEETEARKGFLARLFDGGTKCKGTEGLIKEGEKMMNEDMDPKVMDAAIIASAQKIEHYEIAGYGTARAYAQELGLTEVQALLETTLAEEYSADDRLTALAVGKINLTAQGRSNSSLKNSRQQILGKAVSSQGKQKTAVKKASRNTTAGKGKSSRATATKGVGKKASAKKQTRK